MGCAGQAVYLGWGLSETLQCVLLGEICHAESFPQLCCRHPDFPILLPCLFYFILYFGLYGTRSPVAQS